MSMRYLPFILLGAVTTAAPIQLIIDTDLGFDVDDVGAIAVANYFQDVGEAEILCMVIKSYFL